VHVSLSHGFTRCKIGLLSGTGGVSGAAKSMSGVHGWVIYVTEITRQAD
jgi:hypothetical protein